jgi:outer membrane protein assembly factor BamB
MQGGQPSAPTTGNEQSLEAIIRDIDAAAAPKGVSAETWAALTTELKRLLIARAAGGKRMSIAPTGSQDAVSDLTAMSNGAGTQATLSWTEVVPGDYNNDGAVDIIDLQPVALYYGQWTDSGPYDGHRLVVGDSDPQIGIGDLQAIANNYSAHLQGYQVWRGHWKGTSTDWEATPRLNSNPANPNWSADRPSPPPVSSRPTYVYQDDLTGVTDMANVRYKVVAYGDGAAGAESNVATLLPYPLANSPWPKFRGNMQNTGQSPYVGPQTNHVKWTFVTGNSIGTASPSIAPDGTVYIASTDGYLYALNPADGSLKWKTQTGGGKSSPAVGADGTVYVGGADGKLHAINPIDGSFKWQVVLTATSVESSPAIGIDGTIYVGCDIQLSGTDTFFALNPGDGSFKWKRPLGGSVTSSPAIGLDGTIYVGSNDHNLYALDPRDGSTKWMFTTGGFVMSSPAVSLDGVVYAASADGNIYALQSSDGSQLWSVSTGLGITASPAITPSGMLYVGSADTLYYQIYGLSATNGGIIWKFRVLNEVISSAAVGEDGTVYVGADNHLYALSGEDGALRWEYLANDQVYSSPAIASDGALFFGGDFNGYVYAVGP